jgi:outer membrane protein assembly factor BamA
MDLPGTSVDELRSTSGGLATTRFLGDYKRVRQGVTASTRLEHLARDGNAIGGGIDQLTPSLGLTWFRDGRNVRIDPDRGSILSVGGEYATGFYSDEINFLRGQVDARLFVHTFDRLIIASRSQTILSTGSIPFYRLFSIGGGSSIRGQPTGILVGENLTRASLELRIRLLNQKRLRFRVPFLPGKMSRPNNIDFRLDGVIFSDAGTAWNEGDDVRDAPIKWGIGFGFRAFLPFVDLLRIEMAFDEEGNPSFYLREGNLI